MSTNFYAHLKLGNRPVYATTVFHIGKRVYKGLSTMSGAVFPTVDAWEQFLVHNITQVEVLDEYGQHHDTLKFIQEEFRYPDASENQRNWLMDNGYTIHDAPVAPTWNSNEWWLDGEQLFFNGNFS